MKICKTCRITIDPDGDTIELDVCDKCANDIKFLIPRSDYEKFKANFKWQGHDLKMYELEDLNTPHMFNAFKMIYNNLYAEFFNLRTIEHTKKWNLSNKPKTYLMSMVVFAEEIDRRNNLSGDLRPAYETIKMELITNVRVQKKK